MPDDALKAAYMQARYVIDVPAAGPAGHARPLTLKIGHYSKSLAGLMRGLGANSLAIVTAWNPAARAGADVAPQSSLAAADAHAVNTAAQAALAADVRALGLRTLTGRNLAAQDDTHIEPTLILLDASRGAAQALAVRYGQLAWVHIPGDATPELVWT